MKLIKNAIVYRATLPDASALAAHLAAKPFCPLLENQFQTAGFIPNPTTNELVSEFPGGFAVRLRREHKPLSAKAVKLALLEQVAAKEAEFGRDLAKEEIGELKEAIVTAALKAALPERTELDAFYHAESNTLLIPTTSRDMANLLLGYLVEACGAVETRTINVSNVKGGLTKRLSAYFDGNTDAFAGFSVGDSVLMKGEQGRASFDLDNLDHARNGVLEALSSGMLAERLELCHADAVSFKLTKEFQLRSISFLTDDREETPEFENPIDFWRHLAGAQTLILVAAVQALCDLFGYQDQEPSEDQPIAEQEEGGDTLYSHAVKFVRETGRTSISALQRKLKIGFNRAARMIEAMEQEGIVSPIRYDGTREVIS